MPKFKYPYTNEDEKEMRIRYAVLENHNKGSWFITWKEYTTLWKDKWKFIGLSRGQYQLARTDTTKPYTLDNVAITQNDGRKLNRRLHKDNLTHEMYLVYVQQKNQANFRSEEWNYPFEEWKDEWEPKWHNKGRKKGNYRMHRLCTSEPWSRANSSISTVAEIMQTPALLSVRKKKPVSINGVEYKSMAVAAKDLKIQYTTLCTRIRNKNDKWKEWKFIKGEE